MHRDDAAGSLVLAADMGGSRTRVALVDDEGRVLVERSGSTPSQDLVPEMLVQLLRTVADTVEPGRAGHAVVGLPGPVDYEAGQLLWAPHLPETWVDLLSSSALSKSLGIPVRIANDADLAAVGEAAFGSGAGEPDVAYVTISTGIGAGVVHRGRLLHGRRSLGEIGHTVIDWRAWTAGRPSTLEEIGSGSGLARQAKDMGLGDVEARDIVTAAIAGEDPEACALWNRALTACAVGVCNVIMAFSPSMVVIGGGLGCRREFFVALRDMVLHRPNHHPADLSVVMSVFGDDAGLVGAAAWEAATR